MTDTKLLNDGNGSNPPFLLTEDEWDESNDDERDWKENEFYELQEKRKKDFFILWNSNNKEVAKLKSRLKKIFDDFFSKDWIDQCMWEEREYFCENGLLDDGLNECITNEAQRKLLDRFSHEIVYQHLGRISELIRIDQGTQNGESTLENYFI
jgi:hypothetical protein|tara:strand:- start:2273 stop:2731 length:459 start_codon:yes stop_codon:yes gene_type:complete